MTDYEDTVGNLHRGPYIETGAYLRDCPDCSARGHEDPEDLEKCRFKIQRYRHGLGTVEEWADKHAPCVSRTVRGRYE